MIASTASKIVRSKLLLDVAIGAGVLAAGAGVVYVLAKRGKLDITSQKNLVAGPINDLIAGMTGITDDTVGASLNRGTETVSIKAQNWWAWLTGAQPRGFDSAQARKSCILLNAKDVDACVEKVRQSRL